MKLGLAPALNAQQAYVCRDSYDLRCDIPLLLSMLFHVPENDPGEYHSPPLPFLAVNLGTKTNVHSSRRVLPNAGLGGSVWRAALNQRLCQSSLCQLHDAELDHAGFHGHGKR